MPKYFHKTITQKERNIGKRASGARLSCLRSRGFVAALRFMTGI